MFERGRHQPLEAIIWNADMTRSVISDIAADAVNRFDPEYFWPAHPMDEGSADGNPIFYFGATGVIWALDYLSRVGAATPPDFRPVLTHLMSATKAAFAAMGYGEHGSFLMGDMGTGLVVMRLEPTDEIADLIYARADANSGLPIRELMWGLPGSMLACVHMDEMTGEDRWRALYRKQAARLLDELVETKKGPLWAQDLYGTVEPWLGPVHGFAGNVIPLLRGWKWLDEGQRKRVADTVPRALARNAWTSDEGATWLGRALNAGPPKLCQHCHGAPGMVTALADAPFSTSEFDKLMIRGGELTWAAGPLVKGSNLCHGTGGNGYAFLKLYRRTGDSLWLDRARAFAMTGIVQFRKAREQYGQGRYSLWTGDVGFAIYLWDCLSGIPRFPTIDVF